MKDSEKETLVHEQLVNHYDKYYRIAYSYVFQEQDAMDIVQEGAYRAILKSDSLAARVCGHMDLPDYHERGGSLSGEIPEKHR